MKMARFFFTIIVAATLLPNEGLAAMAQNTIKHRPSVSNSKPAASRQPHPLKKRSTNSSRTNAYGSAGVIKSTGLKAATNVSYKTASHRSAVPSFAKTAARGTAAINGTNMKRKP
jgi:hypothetical protein